MAIFSAIADAELCAVLVEGQQQTKKVHFLVKCQYTPGISTSMFNEDVNSN